MWVIASFVVSTTKHRLNVRYGTLTRQSDLMETKEVNNISTANKRNQNLNINEIKKMKSKSK